MTKEDKDRIEKEAATATLKAYIHKTSASVGYNKGYIAGATSENERLSAEIERLKKELADKTKPFKDYNEFDQEQRGWKPK